MKTQLGKIQNATLGNGGYQDACFGMSFTLGGDTWGVCDFWGTWESKPEKYTDEEWKAFHAETYTKIMKLMKDAKARDMSDLEGKPIEATFDGNTLKSWRILKEVL